MEDKKLEKLSKMITLLNAGITKEEFLKNFQIIINLVKQLQATNKETIDGLESKYIKAFNSLKDIALQETSEELTKQYSEIFNNLKNEAYKDINSLYKDISDSCVKKVENLAKTQSNELRVITEKVDIKLEEVEEKMTRIENFTLPDTDSLINETSQITLENLKPLIPKIEDIQENLPKLGKPIRDALELLPEGERLKIEAIENLPEELKKLEKYRSQTVALTGVRRIGDTMTGDLRGTDFVKTRSSVITRDANGYITKIVKTGGRTIDYTRDISNFITSYTDGVNTWTLTRDISNFITDVVVT